VDAGARVVADSGVLLFAKSPGAVKTYSHLFEGRQMDKTYLAVAPGKALDFEGACQLKLAPDLRRLGRIKVDARHGKTAETYFRGLKIHGNFSLIEQRTVTGYTHQIRVHRAEAGPPIAGDELYGKSLSRPSATLSPSDGATDSLSLGLRAVGLVYFNPSTKTRVEIRAPMEIFLIEYEFTAM